MRMKMRLVLVILASVFISQDQLLAKDKSDVYFVGAGEKSTYPNESFKKSFQGAQNFTAELDNAAILRSHGKYAAAISTLEALEPGVKYRWDQIPLYRELAITYEAIGDRELAAKMYEGLALISMNYGTYLEGMYPADTLRSEKDELNGLAKLFKYDLRPSKDSVYFEISLEVEPKYALSELWIASEYLKKEQIEMALMHLELVMFRSAIRLDDPNRFTLLAHAYMAKKEYRAAIWPMVEAYERDAARLNDLLELGNILIQEKDYGAAANLYEEASVKRKDPKLEARLTELDGKNKESKRIRDSGGELFQKVIESMAGRGDVIPSNIKTEEKEVKKDSEEEIKKRQEDQQKWAKMWGDAFVKAQEYAEKNMTPEQRQQMAENIRMMKESREKQMISEKRHAQVLRFSEEDPYYKNYDFMNVMSYVKKYRDMGWYLDGLKILYFGYKRAKCIFLEKSELMWEAAILLEDMGELDSAREFYRLASDQTMNPRLREYFKIKASKDADALKSDECISDVPQFDRAAYEQQLSTKDRIFKSTSQYWLARRYMEKCNYAMADKELRWHEDRYQSGGFKDAEVYTLLSYANLSLKKYDESKKFMLRAIKNDAATDADLVNVANGMKNAGMTEVARDLCTQALEVSKSEKIKALVDSL